MILDATQRFMELGGQPFRADMNDEALRKMRVKILAEEYNEYVAGEVQGNLVEIADGLADIIVVSHGTMLTYFGPDLTRLIYNEVGRTNLAKVDGSLGPKVIRDDGKIQKPAGWRPPDIRGIINAYEGVNK